MNSTLPRPVARFREIALRDAPASIETVIIDTSGVMRRPGLPTIPLRIRMFHRLGHEFVHEIRIGVRHLAFRFGLDAYVDGHGVMRIGTSVQTGLAFDQGALIALWGEALGFPQAWEHRDDVRWEPLDDDTALLVVPGREGDIPITVGFDPETGCPADCVAERYKARGPKIGWQGTSSEWRRFEGGGLAAGRFQVKWADEAYPWLDLRTESVRVNAPVDQALDLGRRTLMHARRATEPTNLNG